MTLDCLRIRLSLQGLLSQGKRNINRERYSGGGGGGGGWGRFTTPFFVKDGAY